MCSVTGAVAKGVSVGMCVPPCGNLLLWEEHCTLLIAGVNVKIIHTHLAYSTKKHAAIKCADSHTEYRGGKYACVVEKCVMNEFENDADDYTTEIYRTKSAMCSK